MAADKIGLAPVALSIFYVRRTHNRGDEPMLWRRWLKWLIVVDAKRQVLLVQEACSSGPYNSSAMLRPLTEAAREVASARRGSGRCDISIASREPPLRARMVRSGETEPGKAGQGNMAASRPPRPNARRLSEPIVSAAGAGRERVLSAEAQALWARAPGRSLETQRIQALLLRLAYTLYRSDLALPEAQGLAQGLFVQGCQQSQLNSKTSFDLFRECVGHILSSIVKAFRTVSQQLSETRRTPARTKHAQGEGRSTYTPALARTLTQLTDKDSP